MLRRELCKSPHLALLLAAVLVQGCLRNETVTAYGAAAQVWDLERITEPAEEAEQTFAQGTTLRLQFVSQQRLEAETDCLSLSARNTAPYPWFALERIRTTQGSDCTPTAQEAKAFEFLKSRTEVEVSGPYLVLQAPDRVEMIFESAVKDDVPEGP